MKPLYVDELGFELGSLVTESTPLITILHFPLIVYLESLKLW